MAGPKGGGNGGENQVLKRGATGDRSSVPSYGPDWEDAITAWPVLGRRSGCVGAAE